MKIRVSKRFDTKKERKMTNQLKTTVIDSSLPMDSQEFIGKATQYQEMMMRYKCALLEIQTKLEVLNNDISVRYRRNPIEFIKSRLKSPPSVIKKMQKQGLELTIENAEKYINDIAGIRVICSFIDDIYEIARMLSCQDDITVLKVKDYIKNPKPNGYRSFHMIVEVPVFFSDSKTPMKVEIQIRTIAMDFWASEEHDLKYKNETGNSEEIDRELTECADAINEIDRRMQKIRDKVYGVSGS